MPHGIAIVRSRPDVLGKRVTRSARLNGNYRDENVDFLNTERLPCRVHQRIQRALPVALFVYLVAALRVPGAGERGRRHVPRRAAAASGLLEPSLRVALQGLYRAHREWRAGASGEGVQKEGGGHGAAGRGRVVSRERGFGSWVAGLPRACLGLACCSRRVQVCH